MVSPLPGRLILTFSGGFGRGQHGLPLLFFSFFSFFSFFPFLPCFSFLSLFSFLFLLSLSFS
jgi:hypothetical protein